MLSYYLESRYPS